MKKNYVDGSSAAVLGAAFLIGWCFVSAIARILTAHTVQLYNPTLVCFYIFFTTSIFYFVFCLPKLHQFVFIIKHHFFNVIMLNISSFSSWFFLIYPLTIIRPSVVSTITLGLGPLSSILLGKIILRAWSANSAEKIMSCVITIIIFLLAAICFLQKVGVVSPETIGRYQIVMALGACLICGISTSINNLYAKKLSENNATPAQILALRFWLIAILSLIFEITFSKQRVAISFPEFLLMAKLAFLLIIIPLYLVQHGIKYLSPVSVALIAPLMPILIALFEWREKIVFPALLWIAMLAIMLCVFIFGFMQFFWRSDK